MGDAATTSNWERFLKQSLPQKLRAVRDPWLDQDRESKLAIARSGRDLVESVRQERRLYPPLQAFFEALSDPGRIYALVEPGVGEWAMAWAARDRGSLRRALECFLDPEGTPEARFEAFVKVTEEARASGSLSKVAGEAITFGSLLNFSLAPEATPIVGMNVFIRQLRQIKGLDPETPGPVADRYRDHLDFAREVEAEMKTAGVGVRDMLDVQSLMSLAAVRVLPGLEWEMLLKHAPYVLSNPRF
jgi:hypothetical protein